MPKSIIMLSLDPYLTSFTNSTPCIHWLLLQCCIYWNQKRKKSVILRLREIYLP
jgi:hypothetical protein